MAAAAPSAALVDQHGDRFAFEALRGHAVMVAFIYTSCHHVCPLLFDSVGAVQKRALSAGVHDVKSVFVTVDPEIDTPDVLKAYAIRRGADLSSSVFVTGGEAQLRSVWSAFDVKVRRVQRGLVDHPPVTFLLDASGVVRYRYVGAVLDGDVVVADGRELFREAKSARSATQTK